MFKRLLAVWLLGVAVAGAQEAKPVRVTALSELLSPIVFTAPAEVVSANRSRLSARLEARIQRILVDVGDSVSNGDELVVLDCSDHELARQQAEAALESAAARLERARQQLARTELLARDTLLSQDLLEQRQTEQQAARAQARQARVALEQAELTVSRCRVTSPYQGVVTSRLASVGELARPGTPLLELVDLDSVEVAAQVFPAEHPDLHDSRRIYFRFLDEDYGLRIDRSVPVIDPVTRTNEVRLEFTADRAPVGASGRLIWHAIEPGVPASYVAQRDEQLGIFLAREGRAVFHPLPSAREGRPAAVDLSFDTLVVTEGRQGLRDGDPLNIIDD